MSLSDDIESCLAGNGMSDTEREERGDFQFDLLVINGDLTCFGQEEGMSAAVIFVEELQQRRWWRARDILVLPGNHDIVFGDPPPDLESTSRVVIPLPKAKRERLYRDYYRKIALAAGVAGRASQQGMLGELDSRFMGVLKTDKATKTAIFGLDSSRIEGWSNPGLGFVGYDQIQSLADCLFDECEKTGETPWRRIAFLHHHVLAMDPVTASAARTLQWKRHFTLTHDAGEILESAEDYRIDFLIHGHYHRPEIRAAANAVPRAGRVLSAGSPSVRGGDCDGLHQFFIHELFDDPTSNDPPRFRVQDFRRVLSDPPGSWKVEVHEFPLLPRSECSYDRTVKELTRRRNKAGQAGDFLLTYDSYPLAKACLDPPGLMSAATANELYERLDAAWERYRKDLPMLPPMIWVIADVMPYLSQHRKELLQEFESLLDDRDRAMSFEMFLLDKITRDPRYSGASDADR